MSKAHVVIISGLSGSGRTTAIRALEDAGFFCIDNLPIVLLDKFLVLAEHHEEIHRVALGVDTRERGFLKDFRTTVLDLRARGHRLDVIFLDAADEVLIRRYSETRRRHPLGDESTSLQEGIARERRMLAELRSLADWVVDTSELNVHQLKALIQQAYDPHAALRIAVNVVSFGFRHGVPRESDYVFDCRFLPNPYFVDGLRARSGLEAEVRDFVTGHPEWERFFERLRGLLEFTLPLHEREGKPLLTLAFGCTGGRHRSVVVAEAVAAWLREQGRLVRTIHRDVEETG